jgi:ribonucleoside-diphosphate reductase alpha chain
MNQPFRNEFAERIFNNKYKHEMADTWSELSETLINEVANSKMSPDEKAQLIQYHTEMKFIAGGRYLYYAGRPNKFYNNCYLLKAEQDTREDWATLSWKSESALLTGGGIGTDYSIYRESGSPIRKTGGTASGPIPKMLMINEIGRRVMQGGSRRSAIYASLNWQHGDVIDFLVAKDWGNMFVNGAYDEYGNKASIAYLKEKDFDYPAPLDMTNISVNYDTAFLEELYELTTPQIYNKLKAGEQLEFMRLPNVYLDNVRQAISHGEPGFSFNFFDKENETLRNACTEVTSEDDSDVCNLGSVNMSRIDSIEEFKDVVRLASKFLVCGTTAAQLPYQKVYEVREKNRRLGLGLMGMHEWLLARGHKYEMNDELKDWLYMYKIEGERAANDLADKLSLSRPKAYRSIAPTGTISMLANTSSGIEPIYAIAYKRRYLRGKSWRYQYVIDGTAQMLIDKGIQPETIETSIELAGDPERRIAFQADVQDYVDMAISSTINLPEWGTELNNDNHVSRMSKTILKYAHRLRGLTLYPNGSRGGQPITPVDFSLAQEKGGKEFSEEFVDVCDLTGGGVCGS